MLFLSKYSHNTVVWLIFLVLSLTPFLWNNSIYANGESVLLLPSFKKDLCIQSLQLWSPNVGGGTPTYDFIRAPYYCLVSPFTSLDPIFISNVLLSAFIFLSLFWSFSFFSKIYDGNSKIGAFLGAVFYGFNVFLMSTYGWIPSFQCMAFLIPFFCSQAYDFVFLKKTTKPLFMISIFSLLFSVAFSNLSLVPIILFPAFALLSLRFTLKPDRIFAVRSLAFLSAIVIVNLFWIAPFLELKGSFQGGQTIYPTEMKNLFKTPVLSSFVGTNSYWFNFLVRGKEYLKPVSNYYLNPNMYIVMFSLTIFAFLSFIALKLRRWPVFYFGLLLLGGIFLSKGTVSPFGQPFDFLLKNIDIMVMYRAPDIKFPIWIMFGIAGLISLLPNALVKINSRQKVPIGSLIIAILLLVLAFYIFPAFVGAQLLDTSESVYSNRLVLPSYWKEYLSFAASTSGGEKLLILPINNYYLDSYKWGYTGLALTSFTGRQTLHPYSIITVQMRNFKLIFDEITNRSYTTGSVCSFGVLGADSALYRFDFDQYYSAQPSIDSLNFIPPYKNATVITNFSDELLFFKIDSQCVFPSVYSAKKVYNSWNNFVDSNLRDRLFSDETPPTSDAIVNYERFSHTLISINYSSTDEWTLAFNENYDDNWALVKSMPNLFGSQAINAKHIRVNKFSNAWIVPPGKGILYLYYQPQHLYDVLLTLNVLLSILLGVGLIFEARLHKNMVATK